MAKYGKIENGSFVEAPVVVIYNSKAYVNPSATILSQMGYMPVIEDDGNSSKDIKFYDEYYEEVNNQIVRKLKKKPVVLNNENYRDYIQISGGGGGDNEGDNLYPQSLTLTKTKKVYNQGDEISFDDLEVTCTYTDGTSSKILQYTSNANEITTRFAGYKILKVSYTHNGITVNGEIGITINNTDSYNSKQLAYKVTRSGLIKSGLPVVELADKLIQYSKVNFKARAKFVVEVNDSTSNVTLGFGDYTTWGSNTLGGSVTVKPNQVGEFILDANVTFDYNKVSVANGSEILKVYNSGGRSVQGYFELMDVSLTYIEAVKKVPVSITATKTQVRAIIGEEFITDDIVATVKYNTDTTATVTPVINIPNELKIGNNTISISYSEADKTVSTTINMRYYAQDKTDPDEFHDLTNWEWCRAWHKGINVGNCLDSKANSNNTIKGDSNHQGDNAMSQETAYGQPALTLKNFQDIKNQGFDMVRIPVTWCYNSYTEPLPDDDGCTIRHIGKFWTCRVREVVDLALEAGLYVLINMHHEQPIIFTNSTDINMKQVYKDAENCWKEIADKFKHYNEKLAFEGYNEVDNLKSSFNYSAVAAEQMNRLNQIFVDTVRASGSNNVNRVLHCPTTVHIGMENAMNAWVYPNDIVENHIVMNIHKYATLFAQDLSGLFEKYERISTAKNVPICIGEWGTDHNQGTFAARARHAQNFVARAKYHNLFPVVWDNGSSYELVKKYNAINDYGHSDSDLQLIIDGIMKGYDEMKAFALPQEQIITINNDNKKMAHFQFWTPEKGYYDSGWGYATTDPLPATPNKKYIVALDRTGTSISKFVSISAIRFLKSAVNAQGVTEYKVIKTISPNYHVYEYSGTIPSDCDKVIIVTTCADTNIKKDEWTKIFEEGYAINYTQYVEDDIYEVQLMPRTPSELIVDKTVKEYLELNSELDTDDISVTVKYSDGYTRLLSNDEYTIDASNVDMSTSSLYNIIVTATVDDVELSASVEILVGKLLASITSSSELSSKINKSINTHDVSIKAKYSDDTTVTLTEGFTIDTSQVDITTEGTYTVTISYTEGDITRTCEIPYIVYVVLYLSDATLLDKSSVTYNGDFTTKGSSVATPEVLRFITPQQYMYMSLVTDSTKIYTNLLKLKTPKEPYYIYIPTESFVGFNFHDKSAIITTANNAFFANGVSTSGKSVMYKEKITDSQGREWWRIKVQGTHYASDSVVYVTNSTVIPIEHIDSEDDLGDIELG